MCQETVFPALSYLTLQVRLALWSSVLTWADIQVCGHINATVWEHYCNIPIYVGHSMGENKFL